MAKKFKDSEAFVENVGISQSTIYFKIGLYVWKNTQLWTTQVYHRIILEAILKWSKQFVKTIKNYLHKRRTVQMVLLITIVFNLFLFCCETFYFSHGIFYFSVRLFIYPWEFFFSSENFRFSWGFLFFLWKCFSWKFLVNNKRIIWQAM